MLYIFFMRGISVQVFSDCGNIILRYLDKGDCGNTIFFRDVIFFMLKVYKMCMFGNIFFLFSHSQLD